MDLRSVYTTDDEFAEFVHGDLTSCVVGYVDSIKAPVKVGVKNELLFKFVITNGSKRIEILMWGNELIEKYISEINTYRVLNINGAHCKAAVLSEYLKTLNFVAFEMIIKEHTEISFLGYHSLGSKSILAVQDVSFDDVKHASGLIRITGFVRTKFASLSNRTGRTCIGVGAITNGTHKITVQVKQFTSSSLEIGDPVIIVGKVEDDDYVKIQCENMNSVAPNTDDIQPLTLIEAQRGGRSIKRTIR